MIENKNMIPLEEALLAEVEERATKNPDAHYKAKMVSVEYARKIGIPDNEIEKIYNIKLRPEDRIN